MKIALVHDYLTQRGGAERVFEILCRAFPSAPIFTSLYDPRKTISVDSRRVKTSFLQNIPGASRYFRLLAPLYFPAFQMLDLQDYDLIISSTSSFAKAVRKNPKAIHICFCHNVTRFLWDTRTYLQEYKDFNAYTPVIEWFFEFMREIDLGVASNPDIYVANSSIVAERIQKIYNKNALVINYPIDSDKFFALDEKEDFYLVSSRLLSYKRIDIIVEAFNWLGWPLLIVGDGPERERLQAKALDNIQFLGYVSDKLRGYLMAKARALVIAALEDYGLVPIEANASGTPVIAYGAGGVTDTQISGQTGILFKPQTPSGLIEALVESRKISWNYSRIRERAIENFSEQVFLEKIAKLIRQVSGETVIDPINPSIAPESSDIFSLPRLSSFYPGN
ncbi:glycosyltransferase [Pannus brasiliensis CCIBt3594]|uniref:Glycosyltransferase n=1 Tax=Pannus brasiliensis CCIBt3594 TaxID=1427578 RepID=A0AAW9QYG0_9CHRO